MQNTLNANQADDSELIAIDEIDEFFEHHGIKGMSWGIRRWQYKDGSLTPEGYPHYGVNGPREKSNTSRLDRKIERETSKLDKKLDKYNKKQELKNKKQEFKDKKLEDKYKEAQQKEERRKKQEYIDEINGKKKKKKYSEMSDQELQDQFFRLQKEKEVRDLEQELYKGDVSKFIEKYIKNSIGEGIKRGLTNAIDKKISNTLSNDYSKKLSEEQDKLKYQVLTGNSETASRASEKLQDLGRATAKPKDNQSGKSNKQDNSKKDNQSGKSNNQDNSKKDNQSGKSNNQDNSKKKTKSNENNDSVTKAVDDFLDVYRSYTDYTKAKDVVDVGWKQQKLLEAKNAK